MRPYIASILQFQYPLTELVHKHILDSMVYTTEFPSPPWSGIFRGKIRQKIINSLATVPNKSYMHAFWSPSVYLLEGGTLWRHNFDLALCSSNIDDMAPNDPGAEWQLSEIRFQSLPNWCSKFVTFMTSSCVKNRQSCVVIGFSYVSLYMNSTVDRVANH